MAISQLETTAERAVARIEARLDRFEAALERAVGRIETRIDVGHSETRAYVAKSHRRTVLIVLGGLAVATAILAIVIAVT